MGNRGSLTVFDRAMISHGTSEMLCTSETHAELPVFRSLAEQCFVICPDSAKWSHLHSGILGVLSLFHVCWMMFQALHPSVDVPCKCDVGLRCQHANESSHSTRTATPALSHLMQNCVVTQLSSV